ncbi:MAG: MATE family efflux transporter [Phycisphaera sp. TMED9]|nr:MAG: MATE family efflux transporter [Phycisphaera sp. TMED9]
MTASRDIPSPDLQPSGSGIREVWAQAWPTVATMTSYTVMGFIDAVMVARIGPLEVAAQGNGGIWSFNPIAFVFGVLTVVNTFVAQNVGAGNRDRTARYAWAGIWLSVAAWLFLLLPWALLLPYGFAAAGHEPELIELETNYAQILLLGGVLLVTGKAMSHWFFGYQRPRVITISAILANIVNVVANGILIFGEAGIPELGIPGIPGTPALGLVGAAIGTVIGTAVEVLVPLAVFLGPGMAREVGSRANWRPDLGAMRDLLRLGWPAALQFGNEMICWGIFVTILIGRFGTDHLTAAWAVIRYMHLSFMPAVGFSVATTSLVGKWIGAGRPDVAVNRARIALGLAVGYMSVCAIGFFVFRGSLVGVFVDGDVTAESRDAILSIGATMLIWAAVFQTMDAVGIVYSGALRGAGDTVWPGVVTAILGWTFLVGLGAAVVELFPGLSSTGPWIGATAYILIFGVVMGVRFERGRWRQIQLVEEKRPEIGVRLPLGPAAPAMDAASSYRDLVDDSVGQPPEGH